ncbi:MAG TPA: ABC-F family ATP-binding cassette domain-containing protein, partial [Planctomycetota bacterium]|nr:ABC-F family ATP-binding cassette domain-containing protein [Planctomycetota bacterium]
MPLIAWNNLERHFGTHEVLRGVTAAVEKGQKIALVGPNGSGKTTLMKILAGMDKPDAGTLSIVRGASVGYLPQRPEPPPGKTLHDWVMEAFAGVKTLEKELEGIHEAMGTAEGDALTDLLHRQDEINEELERRGGWDTERRAEAILTGLGFRADQLATEAAKLSGGEKSRGALARILCEEPELILLDEPTNHLDLGMLEWLEDWLRQARETVIVVSHDRYFLDRVATHVFAMDRGKIVAYEGNYSRYLELREERIARALKERAQFKEYVEKQREFIRRFKAGQRAKEAAGREKRLETEIEKMGEGPLVEQTGSGKLHSFDFGEIERAGHEVLRTKNMGWQYPGTPKPLYDGLDLEVLRGDRIGVIGPNGSGKTTFLKVIAGAVPAQKGEMKFGVNLKVGYYRQEGEDLDPEKTALDEAHDAAPRMDLVKVRGVLGRFGLTDDEQLKQIKTLSGGERARVTLTKLFLKRANFLLLDEPTNHLDLESIEALVEALRAFDEGTLVFVSHDRAFVSALATRILEVTPQGFRDFPGTYEEYLERCGDDHLDAEAVVLKATTAEPAAGARGASAPPALTWQEQKRRRNRLGVLPQRRDKVLADIDEAEGRKNA